MPQITNTADIIDVREIIARVEELRAERDEYNEKMADENAWASVDDGEAEELATLEAMLADMCGNGGDEQWEGDWYPITLIRESYFIDYAHELAEDTGAISADANWPNNCIDWEQAARELQYDYCGVEFNGVTYWYR